MQRIQKHITLFSIMFLTVYAGAFTTSALCDLEIIDYASNLSHQHDEVTSPEHGDHHTKKIEAHTGHSHDRTNKIEGQEDDFEECCDEISTRLEASLFFSQIKAPLSLVKYFLIQTIDFNTKSIVKYKQDNQIYHEYDDPPPLDGFSLRVVIQSFLN